jgi:large subunit ribosomal protein L17
MRHRIHQRKLNRTTEHRKALLRNMALNLVEHGRITTTLPKAKTLRPFFEKLVTLAVKTRKLADADDKAGSLRARRRIHHLLGDRGMIPAEHRGDYEGMSDARRAKTMRMSSGRRHRAGGPKGRLAFTAESVMHRLIETVAPRFEDRPGGYTRLVRLATRRLGDAAPLAMLQLVGDEEAPLSVTKPGKTARRRRADARYSMAIKAAKSWREKERAGRGAAAEDESGDDALGEPQDNEQVEKDSDES